MRARDEARPCQVHLSSLLLPAASKRWLRDKSLPLISKQSTEAVVSQAQPASSQLSSTPNIKSDAPKLVGKMMVMMMMYFTKPQVNSSSAASLVSVPKRCCLLLELNEMKRGAAKEDSFFSCSGDK